MIKKFLLFMLIGFAVTTTQAKRAFVKAGKQLTRTTAVAYPISKAGRVSKNHYPSTYSYVGVARHFYSGQNSYPSEPVGIPVWPKVVIGVFALVVLFLIFSTFNEKEQNQKISDFCILNDDSYPHISHSQSVELANGGGILIRQKASKIKPLGVNLIIN